MCTGYLSSRAFYKLQAESNISCNRWKKYKARSTTMEMPLTNIDNKDLYKPHTGPTSPAIDSLRLRFIHPERVDSLIEERWIDYKFDNDESCGIWVINEHNNSELQETGTERHNKRLASRLAFIRELVADCN